jgi:hypothetical protein
MSSLCPVPSTLPVCWLIHIENKSLPFFTEHSRLSLSTNMARKIEAERIAFFIFGFER